MNLRVIKAGEHVEVTQVTFADQDTEQHWRIVFEGEHASCKLNFLDLAKGSAKLTTHVEVIHQAPNCTSTQLHKGLYADESQGFLRAHVVVPHDAVGSDASQLHRSLLLSPNARVNAEPHLEINTDEVKAKHGASIGQLDLASLFYLQARGLSEAMAKRLLVGAFAAEVINQIKDESERQRYTDQVMAWI